MQRSGGSIALVKNGHEGLLRNADHSDGFHALFAAFLLFQQFTLAADIAAVALGQNVFTQGFDGLARDNAATDGGLKRNLELVAINLLLEFFQDDAASIFGGGFVRECVVLGPGSIDQAHGVEEWLVLIARFEQLLLEQLPTMQLRSSMPKVALSCPA